MVVYKHFFNILVLEHPVILWSKSLLIVQSLTIASQTGAMLFLAILELVISPRDKSARCNDSPGLGVVETDATDRTQFK